MIRPTGILLGDLDNPMTALDSPPVTTIDPPTVVASSSTLADLKVLPPNSTVPSAVPSAITYPPGVVKKSVALVSGDQSLGDPESVNQYRIIRTIGKGRFATVYDCYDADQKKHFVSSYSLPVVLYFIVSA
jgi:hypothetical protein